MNIDLGFGLDLSPGGLVTPGFILVSSVVGVIAKRSTQLDSKLGALISVGDALVSRAVVGAIDLRAADDIIGILVVSFVNLLFFASAYRYG